MDWAALAPIAAPGGAVGLLGAVAWMVYTGRLVPRSLHEQRCGDLKETAAQALAAATMQAETNRELAQSVRVCEDLIRSMTDAAHRQDAA